MRHNNTIILLHGDGEIVDRGDAICGVNNNAREVMRWPVAQRAAAQAELARHRCTYHEQTGTGGRSVTHANEWALEYCEHDEGGEYLDGGDYELAAGGLPPHLPTGRRW